MASRAETCIMAAGKKTGRLVQTQYDVALGRRNWGIPSFLVKLLTRPGVAVVVPFTWQSQMPDGAKPKLGPYQQGLQGAHGTAIWDVIVADPAKRILESSGEDAPISPLCVAMV